MALSIPSSFKAVHLDKPKTPFKVTTLNTPNPSATEVLIKLSALAINPVDWKVQDSGMFLDTYPAILGEDLSGTIVSVGSSVTRFQAGDRVLAHAHFLWTKDNKHGGFQEFVVVPEISVVKIPEGMKEKDATVLPLAISTAAAGLYQPHSEICLGLDLPSHSPKKSGKSLVIWGGSSSVGTAAIQLAVASGLDVVTTCSKRNFELVEKLGAKAFDYGSPGIVGDLVEELKKGEFVGGYDAIGSRESSMQIAQVIAQFGGGILASVLPPAEDIPATVQGKFVFALSIFYGDNQFVGKAIYENFLPQALASGQILPMPPAEVVGHGMESVEEACQKQKAGVSAKKIVVTV